jgi:hypothetical protein
MTYYAWIPFIILLNGVVFQIPHTIWKYLEGGVIKKFYSEEANNIHTDGENEKILQQNSTQFKSIMNSLKWYHAKFTLCQFLNVVVVIVIFCINDVIFQHKFFDYGAQSEEWNRLCDVFPTRTSCDIGSGGTSNSANSINGLCDLNYNHANQYIFLILWYWFIILFVIGNFQLIFEAVCTFVPAFRLTLLKWKLPPGSTVNLEQFTLGQWFLLFQISRNMQQTFFYEFLRRVSEENVPLVEMANEEV